MEKPWFPQRNNNDAPLALLKSFIFHLDIPISQLTIEKDTKEHNEYPLLSFKALTEILDKWGIKSVAANWDKLDEVPPLSILFIREQEGDIKAGQFIMFYSLAKGEMIEYLHSRKGWVVESIIDFEKKWAKAALFIVDILNDSGEIDFEEKEKSYNKTKFENPELKNISIKRNFLTDHECEYLISLSEPLFNKSMLMGEENVIGFGRNSYTAELTSFPNDEILNGIRKKASKLLEIPETHFEQLQCVSYEPKQEYQNHYDTFDENSERGKKEIEENGQRKYTMLFYLNDDFDGGATYFPNVDLLIHPKKGAVVIFNNLDENGKVIKAAYHAGLPVTKGRKYAINLWVRTKPLRK